MSRWITIISFTNFDEADSVKSHIESHGIKVILKKGLLTAQDESIFSTVIKVANIQIKKRDSDDAMLILAELGHGVDIQDPLTRFLNKLDSISLKIPVISRLHFYLRLLALISIIWIMILVLTYKTLAPSDRYTKTDWCFESLYYQGKPYEINTTDTLKFNEDSTLILPGLNSREIHAKWILQDDRLLIFDSDTLAFIYDGLYNVRVGYSRLKFESDETTFYIW